MNYLFIDTCVWLNIAKSKNQDALVSALEHLIEGGEVKVVVPELIKQEFNRNRDRVLASTRQRLSQEFKQIRTIVEAHGGNSKEKAIEELVDIGSRLPILSEVTGYMADRLMKIMNNGICPETSKQVKLNAVQRALDKKAPFHKDKNSVADAVLIETFKSFKEMNGEGTYFFITDNHTDFSSQGKDNRKPHPDFADIFDENTHYFLTLVHVIEEIAPELLTDFISELEWLDDEGTRGLNDILDSLEEFTDKLWYSRHKYREQKIELGEIQIIPKGDKRNSNDVIHDYIWEGALKAAEKVESKYTDLLPEDDYEWGMLNGKISALRWILGDEWDNLDT